MTAGEVSKVAQGFAVMAAYYRVRIDDQVLRLYAEDVSDLPFDSVMNSMNEYRKNPKNRQMPMPAQIRDMIVRVETPEEKAREIAARIEGAIVKFGYPNGQEARAYIGEEGWEVVTRYGGWGHLCENHGLTISPAAFHAQVRDQLTTTFKTSGGALKAIAAAQPNLSLLSGERTSEGA